jgi:hypothetical protein
LTKPAGYSTFRDKYPNSFQFEPRSQALPMLECLLERARKAGFQISPVAVFLGLIKGETCLKEKIGSNGILGRNWRFSPAKAKNSRSRRMLNRRQSLFIRNYLAAGFAR